jgi:hypothetical protein
MPVRISTARLVADPEHVVSADQYTRGLGPIVCSTRGCPCALTHVPRGTRELKERRVAVAAHFKRAARSNHFNQCRFNVQATVDKLVALSTPVDGGEGMYEQVRNGQMRFRLHILTEALEVARALRAAPPQELDGPFQGRNYVRTARVLTPYLRRAKAIVALAARIGDSRELERLVAIRSGGVDIAWRNFFYFPEDYERLYRRLAIQGPITHPVALVIQAQRIFAPRRPGDASMVSCWFERCVRRGLEFNVQPRLRVDDQAIAARFAEHQWYVVCAVPGLVDVTFREAREDARRPFAYITLDIVTRHQMSAFAFG